MRSISEILNLVTDGRITTQEQAREIVKQEAERAALYYEISVEKARENILASIGYATGYYSHTFALHVLDLFETEHPIFGRTSPTPEEAYRLEQEYAAKLSAKDKAL